VHPPADDELADADPDELRVGVTSLEPLAVHAASRLAVIAAMTILEPRPGGRTGSV
jgi:hypothetical protein